MTQENKLEIELRKAAQSLSDTDLHLLAKGQSVEVVVPTISLGAVNASRALPRWAGCYKVRARYRPGGIHLLCGELDLGINADLTGICRLYYR